MKAISVKQPWASLIVEGIKPIENRTWPCPEKYIGQRVLIHAAIKPDCRLNPLQESLFTKEQWIVLQEESVRNIIDKLPFVGAIIGSVEIVDCVINHQSIWAEKQHCTHHTPCKDLRIHPNCWDGCMYFSKPIYNWVFANPIKFSEPIPAKGKLGFWNFPDIIAEPEEKDGELFCHCQLPVKEENQVRGDSRFGYYCTYCGGKWYK